MAKVQYARVMHNIGGLTGANDNSDMIRGGEDTLTLIKEGDLPEGLDVKRLIDLGAIRPATEDEVARWEGKTVTPDFTGFTTGNQPLHPELGDKGGAAAAGTPDSSTAGSTPDNPLGDGQQAGGDATGQSYKGMGKGELSEYTVPELKDFAKEAGIEGYTHMVKDDLLNALLASGK
jgi:hypothetical protein